MLCSCLGHARPTIGRRAVPPVHWHFDCSFPEDLRADVRAGFAGWDIGGRRMFVEDEGFGCFTHLVLQEVVVHFDPSLVHDANDEEVLANALPIGSPLTTGGRGNFYGQWRLERPSYRVRTATHEAGHILGFDHSQDPRCVMSEHISSNHGFCQRELRAFELSYEKR